MYVCLYVSVYVCIYIQLSLVPTPHFKIVLKLKTKINKTYGGHWHSVPTVLSIDDINLIVIMNVYINCTLLLMSHFFARSPICFLQHIHSFSISN